MNPRILIVDDNTAIHADFQKILCPPPASAPGLAGSAQLLFGSGPAGITAPEFDLTYASSGEKALAQVQQSIAQGRPFALAFMDMQMPPGWNGVETAPTSGKSHQTYGSSFAAPTQIIPGQTSRPSWESQIDTWSSKNLSNPSKSSKWPSP